MTHSIFTRFLSALGVRHTDAYSDAQFEGMTFKSLFGLSHLLGDYKVPCEAYRIEDKTEINVLPTPFLAQTSAGVFVIVKNIDTASGTVEYDSLGVDQKAPLEVFTDAWNGIVLLAYPDANSIEPDYRSHRIQDFVVAGTKVGLFVALAVVIAYFYISRGLWHNVFTTLLIVFNCAGLYLSSLLMLKNLGIKTKAGDRVCGVLQEGGCDDIMSMKVSKLFGVISWSEVGLGYFGVSLATLLLFPHLWGALALFNACCLPYTVWSITYQKFIAKRWCTLCVGVQTTLWLLFFCYLGSGFYSHILPLHVDYIILLAVYVGAVLLLNLYAVTFRRLTASKQQ